MAETMIALLRGINVGRAKRVAMSDLREVVGELGHSGVQTVLNSGNVVFSARSGEPGQIATSITAALAARTGISARVTVLTASQLSEVVAENPLAEIGTDHSRLLVAVFAERPVRSGVEALAATDWSPEALAVGEHAAYVWCPGGVLTSRAMIALDRVAGDAITTRNWRTVLRLHVLARQA